MRRVAAVLVVVLAAVLMVRLARLERTGPPHADITIGDGIPATFYVPGEIDRDFQDLPAPSKRRPPVVVLAHGFAVDRSIMSPFARSLVAHGYAVLAFDWRGHGENRNAFHNGGDELLEDLDAAVDYVEASDLVDPDRLVVMGHSMGAYGVLEFASHDPRPKVVVPLSGDAPMAGPLRPRNVGFIVAENDPKGIHEGVRDAFGRLGGGKAEEGDVVDSLFFDDSSATREVINGVDHATILYSGDAINVAIRWMDKSLGIDRAAVHGRVDPRVRVAALYFLVLLAVLALLGRLLGRFTPPVVEPERAGAWRGLGILTAGLVAAAPLAAGPAPAGFLSLVAGAAVAGYLSLAAGLVLAARVVAARAGTLGAGSWPVLADFRSGWRAALGPAAVGTLGVFLLLNPLAPVFHRFVPTPERLVLLPAVAAVLLPFTFVFHSLLRRGPTAKATLSSVAGRAVVLAVMQVGAAVGVLPGVLVVIIPVLALIFVLMEIVATAIYSTSRNVVTIALLEALWLGWMIAVTMPVTLSFGG